MDPVDNDDSLTVDTRSSMGRPSFLHMEIVKVATYNINQKDDICQYVRLEK